MGEGSGAIATPEVSTIRWTAPFDVLVIAPVDSLGHLLGIPMRDLYLHEEACIAAFTEGLPRLQNLAGPEVPLIAPITTPVIKYGHLNSLGIPILFPETGQVALDMQPMDLGRVARLLEEKRGDDSFGGGLTGRQVRYLGTLRRRFPGIRGPLREDICYATTNRQEAVKSIAGRIDLLLVVGAPNSSNSQRLVEVGENLSLIHI